MEGRKPNASSSKQQQQQKRQKPPPQQPQKLDGSGSNLHASLTSGMDLQEIMARRRRLADGEEVTTTTTDVDSPDPSSCLTFSPETTLKASVSMPEAALLKQPPMSPDLKVIMERRRRMSEAGGTGISSPMASPGVGTAGLTVQIPPYSPSASSSPVRAELKAVAIDPGLKAAMERRRNLVEREGAGAGTGAETSSATAAAAAATQSSNKRGPSAQSTAPPHRQSKSSRNLASSSSSHKSGSTHTSRQRQHGAVEQHASAPAPPPPLSTQSSRSDDAVMMAGDDDIDIDMMDDDKDLSVSKDDLELVLDSTAEDEPLQSAPFDENVKDLSSASPGFPTDRRHQRHHRDVAAHAIPEEQPSSAEVQVTSAAPFHAPLSLRRPGPTPQFPSSSLDEELDGEDPSLSSSRAEPLSSPSSPASPYRPQSLRRPGPQPQFPTSSADEVSELVELDEEDIHTGINNDLEVVGTTSSASTSAVVPPSAEKTRKSLARHSSSKHQQRVPGSSSSSSSTRRLTGSSGSKEEELEQLDALVSSTTSASEHNSSTVATSGGVRGGEHSSSRKQPSSRHPTQRKSFSGDGGLSGEEKFEKPKRSNSGNGGGGGGGIHASSSSRQLRHPRSGDTGMGASSTKDDESDDKKKDTRSLEKLDKGMRTAGVEGVSGEAPSVSSDGAENSPKSKPTSSPRKSQSRRSSAGTRSSSGEGAGAGAGGEGTAETTTSLESLHRASRRRSSSSRDCDDFSRAESVVSSRSGSSRLSGTGPGASGTARRSGGRRSKSGEQEHGPHRSSMEGFRSQSTGDLSEEDLQQHQQQHTRDRNHRAIANNGKSASSRSFDSSDDGAKQPAPRPRRDASHRERRGSKAGDVGEGTVAASPISSSGHGGDSSTAPKTSPVRKDSHRERRSSSKSVTEGERTAAMSPVAAGHEGESSIAPTAAPMQTSLSAPAAASTDSLGFGDVDPWGTVPNALASAESGFAADAWGGVGAVDFNTSTSVCSDPHGWGGLASFPSSGGPAEASGLTSSEFAGFPSDGVNLGESGAFPSATTKATTEKTLGFQSTAFDFGSDDGFGGGDFGFAAFGAETVTPKVPIWDTSPLVDVPVRPSSGDLSLVSKTMFTASIIGEPVTNPLNGNIIFCSSGPTGATIHEIDPHRDNLQVGSATIMSSELQRRVAAKYNVSVCSLGNLMSLTAGLHYFHGQARLRVAALLDLKVIENPQLMRVVAIWQWGYSLPNPFSLQFALTPPSGGEFTYDPKLLQVADGLIFIGGSSPKGPCIFMCRPTVRETWSANFLGGAASITCMSVTPNAKRNYPYLAVALSDRTVSIWTYKGALSGPASKSNEPSKRLLFPLCRLEASSCLMDAEMTSLGSDFPGSDTNDPKDAGLCTQLTWLPPQPSMSSLPLVAASFQNGLAVFHVGLPVVVDVSKGGFRPFTEPNQNTTMMQTPCITPLSVKRWPGRNDRSFACWLNFGAHTNPCIAILIHAAQADGGSAHVLLGSLPLQLYRRCLTPKERMLPFDVLACSTITKETDPFPRGLLHTSSLRHLMAFAGRKIIGFAPSRSLACISQLGHPISSDPPGLTSLGEPFFSDAESDKDGILHIFTVAQCERQKSDSNPTMHEWSRPRRRHWLCRTLVGDTKDTAIVEEVKEDGGFGGNTVKGGATSDVVCELFDESLEGLVPFRIVRCQGGSVCAVHFRPALSIKSDALQGFSLDASHISIVDYAGSGSIHVIEGRDVAFWPIEGAEGPRGVVLSANGSTLTSFVWDSSKRICKMGSSSRPIVGVDTDVNYVECRRVFGFSGASTLGLVVLGTRHRDGKWCLLSGDLCAVSSLSTETWSSLLPNIVSGSILWFDDGEEVFSVVGLEYDDNGYRNFAVATSTRVLIASSAMEVAASVTTNVCAGALAPLGSFAVAFCAKGKLRYLSCLDAKYASGAIATLPVPQCGSSRVLLAAVRPDRILVLSMHDGARLVEHGQSPNTFLLPTAVTLPALLLEPMVANAIGVGGKQNVSTPVLRTVIEKFGRKLASITHGDEEGIGNIGAGLTPRTFEILEKYGLSQAASWLLTGTVLFDRSANSRILPPWLPIAPKARGAQNSDAFLHVISNGDQYLSEYFKSPDDRMPSSLPHASGPIAYICREYAAEAIRHGRPYDALKTLDIAGSEACDSLILELSLALSKDRSKDVSQLLKALSGYDDSGLNRSSAPAKAPASLAALAVSLKQGAESGVYGMNKDQVDRWMKPLAPSLQRGSRITRPRQAIFGKTHLMSAGERVEVQADPVWVSACNESKHVWNEGPRKEKNNLLMLDSIEEWLGRKRPVILGKEGASAARDRGEKTLADILNKEEEDSFGGKSDLASEKDGWVDGVGEGRSDEANLSAYFRMSEGEDEDSPWRSEGFEDLSPYQNRAKVVGDTQSYSLQPTSSSVDEGEPGKAKMLYDLVFEKSGDGIASGLAISALRGGSLDVGVLLQLQKNTRHKCSIEFWFYLPSSENVPSELVLVRRTMGPHADDLSKVCLAADKDSVLWELVVQPKGQLSFQTCAGARLLSTQNFKPSSKTPTATQDGDSDDEKTERPDLARFGRWNHVCIVITQQSESCTKCSVALYMKGSEVASSVLSMQPRGFDEDDLDSDTDLDKLMKKSHVVFGLNHGAGFRLTELRVWACERSADDTQSLLYEYLTAAEAKKKFKVKISNKKGGVNFGKGLAAPTLAPLGGKAGGRSMLAPTRSAGLAPSKGFSLAPSKGFSLAPQRQTASAKASVAPPEKPADEKLKPIQPSEPSEPSKPPQPSQPSLMSAESEKTESTIAAATVAFEAAFSGFGEQGFGETQFHDSAALEKVAEDMQGEEDEQEDDVPTTLWDTAVPLSQQVRSSAAAALIRGPPATRHFGGNRGGLPDFSGMDRFGVGGVAICGSEKTIVWRDNEDPPALTYPIGASGAVVSDLMDDEGSEFLCCFLAKEKRMVVFELQSRTVVVELQMTTKLNFWRFLPPEAAANTLCFMLVTPVGGFHWMPLEESPRPHQVWKRGPELQGKKVVSYEEGGSNGLDGAEILSSVGLVMVTKASGGGSLEAWIIPVDGDSQAGQISDDVMGACLCQPPVVEDGPFLPLLLTVHHLDEGIYVNVLSVTEPKKGSVQLGEIEVTRVIEDTGFENVNFEPPDLAMGSFPEAICCSLGNIVVIILRRKGLIAAFELEEDDLSLIALEGVGHYVVDAVMRYSAEVGGAEIVMLLSDEENPKDGRMVSFCFRSAV